MKNIIKLIPCLIFVSFVCASYAEVKESSVALRSKDDCEKRAHKKALEINAAIDATFPLLVPATAEQGAAAFASFFAENGVFQSPATLTVERTWYATLTADRDFCGTVLKAGETYSQDDCLIIRFACKKNCRHKKDCVLPGKVVYYNESFSEGQFESNFTSVYPAPCDRLEN